MHKTLSAAAAKARFADCVREAEHGAPILITRHGKAVAALVAAGDLKAIQRLRAAGPRAGLAGVLGGWEGSEEIVLALSRSQRSRSRRIRGLD